MSRLYLEVWWHFHIAQPFDDEWAARMEAASRRWVDQAGRLASRDFFKGQRILVIWLGSGGQQGQGIGVFWIAQQIVDLAFFDQLPGVHDEDALREITHCRKVVSDVDDC